MGWGAGGGEPCCRDLEGDLQVLLWANYFSSLYLFLFQMTPFFLTHTGALEAMELGGGSTL